MGVLRAMADDYGVLGYLEHKGDEKGCEILHITLLESEYARGREFELGARSA